MKVNYIKIGVITAVSLGAVYGVYRLVDHIKSLRENQDGAEDDTVTTDVKTETAKVTAPKFDGNKVVKKGSKGNEVGAVQMAINNIIDDAKKGKAVSTSSSTNSSANTLFTLNSSNTLVNPYTGQPLGGWGAGTSYSNANGSTAEALRLKISALPKLVVDNDFGNNTLKHVKSLMLTESTTYNKVKQKRKDLATMFGLSNPY